MTKIILSGYIVVPGDELDTILYELPRHIELTRNEPGCLVFKVEQDEQQNNTFHVYEEFVNEDAFLMHQQRVKTSRWGMATKNVQRNYQVRSE